MGAKTKDTIPKQDRTILFCLSKVGQVLRVWTSYILHHNAPPAVRLRPLVTLELLLQYNWLSA